MTRERGTLARFVLKIVCGMAFATEHENHVARGSATPTPLLRILSLLIDHRRLSKSFHLLESGHV